MITLVFCGGMALAQTLQIAKPEMIAGRWETSDGQGDMVGMAILLTTHVVGTPVSLVGQPLYLDQFVIGLYQRNGPEVAPLGFNFYVADENGGASWDGEHLQIHAPQSGDLPKTNVELIWDRRSHLWTGSFEYAAFHGQVTLKRPASFRGNAFVGTWFAKGEYGSNCVHIAQQSDEAFTAWSDGIQILGRTIYANGLQPPSQTLETFGDIAKVQFDPPDRISIELRALTAICCSHPFKARIAADGKTLVGDWIAGPNQFPRPVEWKKMQGDSCIAAASEPPLSSACPER